nr:PTS sugar transporter subunit IIC [Fructobacillus ficulneus]
MSKKQSEAVADFEESEKATLVSEEDHETLKEKAYNISAAVSNAILVTLGMGFLMQSLGTITHWTPLLELGLITKILLPPAFGAAIASQLKTNTMVMFSAMAASTVGANAAYFTTTAMTLHTATGFSSKQAAGGILMTTGQPISAVLAGLVAVLFGKWLSGKTPLDMIIVPAATTLLGTVAGYYLAIVTTPLLVGMGKAIAATVNWNSVVGTALVAMLFAIFLMTPASSAALALAIGATGVSSPMAAGAMLVGTAAMFASYPAMSFHENKPGTFIAQAFVTPKIQFPNLVKNPMLFVPPLVSAAICAPIGAVMFHLTVPFSLAGMGLTSLIVPLDLMSKDPSMLATFMVFGVAVPAALSFVLYRVMMKFGWIKSGDTHLDLI